MKSKKLFYTNKSTQTREQYLFENSSWYDNYVLHPRPLEPSWNKSFCNRFRMTHECFLQLVGMCRASDTFNLWRENDVIHRFSIIKVTSIFPHSLTLS